MARVPRAYKTTSVCMVTRLTLPTKLCAGSSTSAGWVLVTAVKVNELDGGATVVVRNVHPTNTMGSTFSLNFAVFNAN